MELEERDPTRCVHCSTSETERRLLKCTICHRKYCEECGARHSGRTFCSRECGQFFFHDDETD